MARYYKPVEKKKFGPTRYFIQIKHARNAHFNCNYINYLEIIMKNLNKKKKKKIIYIIIMHTLSFFIVLFTQTSEILI